MSELWRDINDPGPLYNPDPEPEEPKKLITGIDESPAKKKAPIAKEYRFKDVSIIEPAQGFERNMPFDIEGEIDLLGDKLTASKILLYPIGIYNGQEDKFVPGGIEADLDTSTNKFRGTCDHLFDPEAFANDKNKPADAIWKLVVRAEGAAAEKAMESEQLTFPKPLKFVVLKKGDYDEEGASKYSKPQSGENFKPNGVVKALQGDLIKTCFLPQGSDDGFFGDNTDAAVKRFQDYAIKSVRLKRKVGKTETVNMTLNQQQPDGIVGKNTRADLDRWLQKDWIKPIPTLRYSEYDDTGVSNGKGQCGTEDHHQGTPIEDSQKNLQSVGVYTDGNVDGWFLDKMKHAVKLFQEAAVKGEFIINGILTYIGEQLTGHHKGDLCPKTQEYLKMVKDKGGKVPEAKIGGDDYEREYSTWFNKYDVTPTLTKQVYESLGKIKIETPPLAGYREKKNKTMEEKIKCANYHYPDCDKLSEIDLVARCIFAEICNDSPYRDNAFGYAQLIRNRMQDGKSAKKAVLASGAFDVVRLGVPVFGNPIALGKDNKTWTICCFLAAQLIPHPTDIDKLVKQSKSTNIKKHWQVFDTQDGNPFFIDKNDTTPCPVDIIAQAKYYGKHLLNNGDAIAIGPVVYFDYIDKVDNSEP